jgi:hypothetical protein
MPTSASIFYKGTDGASTSARLNEKNTSCHHIQNTTVVFLSNCYNSIVQIMATSTPPFPQPIKISDLITIQTPLTRAGKGPGMIICIESELNLGSSNTHLEPAPLQKWAEEGFCVAQINVPEHTYHSVNVYLEALQALSNRSECFLSGKGSEQSVTLNSMISIICTC